MRLRPPARLQSTQLLRPPHPDPLRPARRRDGGRRTRALAPLASQLRHHLHSHHPPLCLHHRRLSVRLSLPLLHPPSLLSSLTPHSLSPPLLHLRPPLQLPLVLSPRLLSRLPLPPLPLNPNLLSPYLALLLSRLKLPSLHPPPPSPPRILPVLTLTPLLPTVRPLLQAYWRARLCSLVVRLTSCLLRMRCCYRVTCKTLSWVRPLAVAYSSALVAAPQLDRALEARDPLSQSNRRNNPLPCQLSPHNQKNSSSLSMSTLSAPPPHSSLHRLCSHSSRPPLRRWLLHRRRLCPPTAKTLSAASLPLLSGQSVTPAVAVERCVALMICV